MSKTQRTKGAVVHIFSAEQARCLTDEVKADAAALWAKLLRLYEGGAHTALSYSSWADYCAVEFDYGRRTSYRLLDAARAADVVTNWTLPPPRIESVARELAPLLDEPDLMREAWSEVVAEHGPEPTAAQTREVVRQRQTPANDMPHSEQTDDERLGQLPNDLVTRVQADAMSLDEAEEIAVEREQRLQVWVADVRRAITVLTRLAGYPVPAGITTNLDQDEQANLMLLLAGVPAEVFKPRTNGPPPA